VRLRAAQSEPHLHEQAGERMPGNTPPSSAKAIKSKPPSIKLPMQPMLPQCCLYQRIRRPVQKMMGAENFIVQVDEATQRSATL
jgi:hypothetical protein